MTGLSLALSEITLVVFTTLAPSGAVALALLCALVAAGWGPRTTGEGARLIKLLWVPIVVTMVGLVASATHLGNPSNALYVLTGIGRSPLSTEVGAAIALLAGAGLFWLYGFSERPRRGLQRAWAGALVVLAAIFVTAIAFAYSTRTIPSWNTPFVPVALWLGALTGGPVLALAVLRAATSLSQNGPTGLDIAALALASTAALTGAGIGVAQGLALPELRSSLTSAAALVPHYWRMLAAAIALQLVGIVLAWRIALRRSGDMGRFFDVPDSQGTSLPSDVAKVPDATTGRLARHCLPLAGASALVFAGLFITRFAFYMTHLTSGL